MNGTMMTSSNGSIFCVTGPLRGNVTRGFPSQRPVTWSFDGFFQCMEFYLIKNQSYLLHRIIQKTYSSIITALFCVGFDVVITDIKTKMFSWP